MEREEGGQLAEVKEAYFANPKGGLKVQEIETWYVSFGGILQEAHYFFPFLYERVSGGLCLDCYFDIWERRKDLGGTNFKVGVVPFYPHYQREPGQHPKDASGFAMDMWRLLQGALNFTSRLVFFCNHFEMVCTNLFWISFEEQSSYGTKDPVTMKFNGLSAKLASGEVDISASALMVTSARKAEFDFLTATMINGAPLFYKVVKVRGVFRILKEMLRSLRILNNISRCPPPTSSTSSAPPPSPPSSPSSSSPVSSAPSPSAPTKEE